MRLFFSIALLGLFTSLSAQETITYPYNPDSDGDAYVATADMLETLAVFGSEFTPAEIQIDGVNLTEIILQMQTSIEILQNTVNELEAENVAQASLISELQESSGGIEGLDNYLSVDEESNTVLITGANLQVINGTGTTYGDVNGTGNIIIGYNENIANDKSGSHNLVIGSYHTYSSYGGIVAGTSNRITGACSSVLGGIDNSAQGEYSFVSGGSYNQALGWYSSVSGGYNNQASGGASSVSGGYYNTASGDYSSVSGGFSNTASGYYSSVSGDAENTFLDNSADGNTID